MKIKDNIRIIIVIAVLVLAIVSYSSLMILDIVLLLYNALKVAVVAYLIILAKRYVDAKVQESKNKILEKVSE